MIVDTNLPQKIKLGGEYNVESVINEDGTQTLNITTAEKAFDRLQWKCDNIKSLRYEFYSCPEADLTPIFAGLDTSQVKNTSYMFAYSSDSGNPKVIIPLFDTSNVTDMSYMFYHNTALTEVPNYNTSNVTDMSNMFSGCLDLIQGPEFDTSKVTKMTRMFYDCNELTQVPQYNTSNVTDMSYMFYSCDKLTTIPQLDTSSVTDMSNMFKSCKALTAIPQLNTSNVTNMTSMFMDCSSLTEIPELNTSNVKSFSGTFSGCRALKTIAKMDMIKGTSLSAMFSNCVELTNLTITNIKQSLAVGSGTSYGHLLTLDSLINTVKELWDYSSGTTTYKLSMSPASKEKIANTYVKLITPTQEQIEADPYINNKLPCEVCESTDEGAMLITDYATLKKWTIA